MPQDNSEQPKKKRGPSPVIVPRKISKWISDQSSRSRVNDWKVGGGISPNK